MNSDDRIKWFEERKSSRENIEKLLKIIMAEDCELMANGYQFKMEKLCLLPSATEAEKELVNLALKIAKIYEENARKEMLEEIGKEIAMLINEDFSIDNAIEEIIREIYKKVTKP